MQEDCQLQASLCCTKKEFPEYQTKTIKWLKSLWKAFPWVMMDNLNQHRNICKQDISDNYRKPERASFILSFYFFSPFVEENSLSEQILPFFFFFFFPGNPVLKFKSLITISEFVSFSWWVKTIIIRTKFFLPPPWSGQICHFSHLEIVTMFIIV